MVNYSLIFFWLEIVLLVFAIIIIFLSLFKNSSAREALSSISGGSQELFLNRKSKLSHTVMTVILIVIAIIMFAIVIAIRILWNTI